MQDNESRDSFYTMFNALKSVGKFSVAELRSLLARNDSKRTWSQSLELMAMISNLSLGRPTVPGMVDAVIADRRFETCKSYYARIADFEEEGEERIAVIELLGEHGVFGSFQIVVDVPSAQRDWRVKHLRKSGLKVFTIADRWVDQASYDRYTSYTIFDNLGEPVYLDEIGTDYLNCLPFQITQYSGSCMIDLYMKFLSYADVMLETHRDHTVQVTYRPITSDSVKLSVGVFKKSTTPNRPGDPVVVFEETLTKRGS